LAIILNKKLISIMIVPILVVMSGALAFSSWSGTGTAIFGMSDATVSYSETLDFMGTNATNINPVMVGSNANNMVNATAYIPGFEIMGSSGVGGTDVTVYANVTNMVPGTWVWFQIIIKNTGSATLNTSTVFLQEDTFFNELGQQAPSSSPIAPFFAPPLNMSYVTQVAANGLPQYDAYGPIFLLNESTSSSTPSYLGPGQSIVYDVVAVLPAVSNSNSIGDSYAIEVTIPLIVQP
jgi:hypothetical protein